MNISVGIDLGTTYSAVARFNKIEGRAIMLQSSFGKTITPSVLVANGNDIVWGDDAKEQLSCGADGVAFYKRNMGDENYKVLLGKKQYDAKELSSIFLERLMRDIQETNNVKITSAVVTVPAYFTDRQKNATLEAGRKAGLNITSIINEPTAAIIAYGLTKEFISEKIVMVYDLGGGTFDVTIAKITSSGVEVLGSDGNHTLGGKDWDEALLSHVKYELSALSGKDVDWNEKEINELMGKCEQVKRQLSGKQEAEISMYFNKKEYKIKISRQKLKEITESLVMTTELICTDLMERISSEHEKKLNQKRIDWKSIDEIVLVGGSTRMPMISEFIESLCYKKPMLDVNVDEIVALGAAIQAELDLLPKSGALTLKGKGSVTLTLKSGVVKDAAAHALGMLSINEKGDKYINSVLIKKNVSTPCTETRPFKIPNNSDLIEVYVLQGDDEENPINCSVVGKYTISNIIKEKNGIIDISYSYDKNGVIGVSAVHRGKSNVLNIKKEIDIGNTVWMNESPKKVARAVPSNIFICIDLSGSMSGEPLREAKNAAANDFLKSIDLTNSRVGVMGVADSTKVYCELCNNADKITRAIHDMNIGDAGYGNSAEPFADVRPLLSSSRDAQNFIVVLADGVWNDQNKAIVEANKCKQNGVQIIAIGFGGADKKFLSDIATSQDMSAFVSLNQLGDSFSTIAQAMTSGESLKLK